MVASLGLVDLLPNRSASARPFGPRAVNEISRIRRVLDTRGGRARMRSHPDEYKPGRVECIEPCAFIF
jgi:hypothetical protein